MTFSLLLFFHFAVGTTPQRKNYSYPRLLAATSPHDRILERLRSRLDTGVAVDVPLNSSFSVSFE